jgi:hypothetical protein
MRARQFLSGVFTGVVLTLFCAAIALAILATRPLPRPTQPTEPSASGDLLVSVEEGYLSALATDWARSEEESIQAIVVDVLPGGRVDTILTVRMRMMNVNVGLQMKLASSVEVDEGWVRFSLLDLSFVGMRVPLELLPVSLRTRIENMETEMNQRMNSSLIEYGLVPLAVSTDQTSITVELGAQ